MSSNMKAFSITHIISVIVGGATSISALAIEFSHNPSFNPLFVHFISPTINPDIAISVDPIMPMR